MKALHIPEDGELTVLTHERWDGRAIDAVLGGCLFNYEWPHPPHGRSYTVFHRDKADGWGISLVGRRPSLVIRHNGRGFVDMDRTDLFYLGTFVVFEQQILAFAEGPPAIEGGK